VSLDSTKADDIALVIEEAIVSGELAPGTVLRQEQLSEQFKVSRTPIREALRRLAALGLVSFVPNRGVRVRTISREELHEAFMVRAELEGLATEVAAGKMTPEDLAELDEVERRFSAISQELRSREPGDERRSIMGDWVRANHTFHDVIYRVADLPLVEQLAKSARRTFSGPAVWAPGDHSLDGLYLKNAEQHRAIKHALMAGSAAGARALAREHVLSSFHLLETILEQVGAQPRDWQRGRSSGRAAR
jgi:DNA-binding GntR family transcriptional regulator